MSELAVIFGLCLISEGIAALLPVPFPASVIALLLLGLLLFSKLLKPEHIQKFSAFLVANMAFFFIPAGVNVINYLDILKASWLPLLVICLVTTVITFAATAFSIRLTVYLLRRKGGQQHE